MDFFIAKPAQLRTKPYVDPTGKWPEEYTSKMYSRVEDAVMRVEARFASVVEFDPAKERYSTAPCGKIYDTTSFCGDSLEDVLERWLLRMDQDYPGSPNARRSDILFWRQRPDITFANGLWYFHCRLAVGRAACAECGADEGDMHADACTFVTKPTKQRTKALKKAAGGMAAKFFNGGAFSDVYENQPNPFERTPEEEFVFAREARRVGPSITDAFTAMFRLYLRRAAGPAYDPIPPSAVHIERAFGLVRTPLDIPPMVGDRVVNFKMTT